MWGLYRWLHLGPAVSFLTCVPRVRMGATLGTTRNPRGALEILFKYCLQLVREQEFLSPSRVLPAGPRIHLTWERLTGEKSNLIAFVQGIHTDLEIPKTGKRRHMSPSELRRRGRDFKGKACTSWGNKKSRSLVIRCLPWHTDGSLG